jgi:hypothetical protein
MQRFARDPGTRMTRGQLWVPGARIHLLVRVNVFYSRALLVLNYSGNHSRILYRCCMEVCRRISSCAGDRQYMLDLTAAALGLKALKQRSSDLTFRSHMG